ncbi:hypothetical protein M436DRAFT_62087 [Aureobasidium namibiae CBS 147.97]|uniref:F-box domain-containing protein n=1 Tax=Aureobasidium namibiae CBS 147.97 TaxID=1043004 RepID=A0A074WRA4_9PEZI
MKGPLQLPPELLSRIVDLVAIGETLETNRDDEPFNQDCNNKYNIDNEPPASGLSYQHSMLAITPRPDVTTLRNLRLASRGFAQMCTTRLFGCIRLLPTEESSFSYNQILSEPVLSNQVRKVVFQTRMVPGGSTSFWSRQEPGPGDDYSRPHPFFLDALQQVGRFSNLTHVEMVFGSQCIAPDSSNETTERVRFREGVLSALYAGLNHCEHPAMEVFNLSIKNLQDRTPHALINNNEDEDEAVRDIKFRKNFAQVMSRITHLSLQVATEDEESAPETTLDLPESHNFFGYELRKYWVAPIAENLVYFKLYACDMLFGTFPACNLPKLPELRTLILGNLSMCNEDHIDWILSHAATLEELILDDAVVAVGTVLYAEVADEASRRIIYSSLTIEDGRPLYQPKLDHALPKRRSLWLTRWHHIFGRLQRSLPKLKHFAMGHGNWDEHKAFDEAEILQNVLTDARYQYLDRGTGPDN